ncbi:MAG: type II toxin-antitoxin system prevent-host-death family antitoxin [Usitatibacter sp.]
MYTVNATELKNRLGPVLARAELETVAVVRHGRVVAYLTPARAQEQPRTSRAAKRQSGLDRHDEVRLVQLCASGDLRPSRWLRAGDPRLLAGVATMLASEPGLDRVRFLALAERLYPGMSTPEEFGRWLREAPVKAARLLPMVRAEGRRKRK